MFQSGLRRFETLALEKAEKAFQKHIRTSRLPDHYLFVGNPHAVLYTWASGIELEYFMRRVHEENVGVYLQVESIKMRKSCLTRTAIIKHRHCTIISKLTVSQN